MISDLEAFAVMAIWFASFFMVIIVLLGLTRHRECEKCGWNNYNLRGNKCPNCNEPYKKDKKPNGVLFPFFEGANLKNSQEGKLNPVTLFFF